MSGPTKSPLSGRTFKNILRPLAPRSESTNARSEIEFAAQPDEPVDFKQHQPLLDNVRLWDWHAFHDAITQLQPYRPYIYSDTDVDRYTIDGQLRQMMLSPRELDLTQLGEAGTRWINPHFIYTHGYGIVMAEANQVSPNGLPELIIKDAPPVISAPGLKLTRPELYYGENVQDPVFVDTAQAEFDYPSGDRNVETHYQGKGGFPISSLLMRTAAAVSREDINILLTGYLTQDSRMMIRRNVTARLSAMADFLNWDPDPYLVLTDAGRLVWIIDGYMTSDVHPYSAKVGMEGVRRVQLHPQFRKSYRGRLRWHGAFLRFRTGRSAAPGLSESVSRSVRTVIGHARRSAPSRPLSGNDFPRAGRHLPAVPHARPRHVLQQVRCLGHREIHQ